MEKEKKLNPEWVISMVLWFFLGGLGLHRFYNGQTGTGVLYIVLTVLGFLTAIFFVGLLLLAAVGIWWLIDGIILALGKFTNAENKFVKPMIES